MKAVILDAYTTNPGDLSWDWLKKLTDEYTVYDFTYPDEVYERTRGCDIVITNKTKLMKQELDALDKTVYIGLLSTGYDAVDSAYARSKNITVANIPAYATNGVAQMVFSLLLEMTNRVALHDSAVKAGEWQKNGNFCFWKASLTELCGKTMGIIGYGKIGKAVAKIALAFGMRVIVNTEFPENDGTVEFVTLNNLLSQSDVVSLHCPYTAQTDKLVNSDFLNKMRTGSYLINTSRGAVVDETALRAALDSGKLAGAGIDVLSSEPPKADNPLYLCEKCLVTPHISWASYEARSRLMGICEENIKAFLAGSPMNVVN